MLWSQYQTAIFEAVSQSTDSLLIEACAGAGKTSTIVEAIKYVPSDKSICMLAFNKRIAEELQKRVTSPNARCMTLHAAGWAAWRRAVSLEGACEVDGRKTAKVMQELQDQKVISERDRWKYAGQMGRLISLAKGAGLVPEAEHTLTPCSPHPSMLAGLVPDTDDVWMDLIDHYGLEEEECSIPLARKVLAESIARGKDAADFDDMLYLPLIHGVPFERYDVLFVDEAQDVSPIQMEMIERMVREGGRIVAVGDRKQSIYGFRGADCSAMDKIQERFRCKPLPLSISYRCPKAVVLHAQQWVPHLEYAESAVDGYVGEMGTDWAGQAEVALGAPICFCGHGIEAHSRAEMVNGSEGKCYGIDCGCLSYLPDGSTGQLGISKFRGRLEDFHEGDAILCRVNRPLIALAFRLIRARVPCKVLGRDIGQGLVALIKKLTKNAPGASVSELQVRVDRYRAKETQRLTDRKEWAALGQLTDKLDCLETFMSEAETVAEVVREIEGMFGEGQVGVTLSSIHKAKGLEWSRVFVLDRELYQPSPWAKRRWELDAETNLLYVGAMRAKAELRYISSGEIK